MYQDSAFFRSSDYKPEIIFSGNLNAPLGNSWKLQFINIGAIHESNGYGNELERSWNRVYLETIFSNNAWMISIRPWYIINDRSLRAYNNDIDKYLGHGRAVIAYNYNNHVFSGEVYNIERIPQLTSVKLTWSFPLLTKIKGYAQFFHGFGYGLVDYNKRKNNISVGLAFNDWI